MSSMMPVGSPPASNVVGLTSPSPFCTGSVLIPSSGGWDGAALACASVAAGGAALAVAGVLGSPPPAAQPATRQAVPMAASSAVIERMAQHRTERADAPLERPAARL